MNTKKKKNIVYETHLNLNFKGEKLLVTCKLFVRVGRNCFSMISCKNVQLTWKINKLRVMDTNLLLKSLKFHQTPLLNIFFGDYR